MTTPFLVNDLMRDEGLRLRAYPDPVSGGAPWTIGYGHTGPDARQGAAWTQGEATEALIEDIAIAQSELDEALAWWRTLDDVRQDVMVEMAFNLGIGGLRRFHRMLGYVQSGAWAQASANMLLSAWAGEVGARATRLAAMMRSGSRPV